MPNEESGSGQPALEEQRAIEALSASDIEAIDFALLSRSSGHWQKTAMLVVGAMYAYPDKFEEIPDYFYGQRISALVDAGLLEASGDLSDLRHSEVRRP